MKLPKKHQQEFAEEKARCALSKTSFMLPDKHIVRIYTDDEHSELKPYRTISDIGSDNHMPIIKDTDSHHDSFYYMVGLIRAVCKKLDIEILD